MRKGYLFKAVGAASALAMITGLAACGSDTASTDNGGKVEISFQTKNLKSGYESYFNDLIKAFEKDNPNITVNWIDQPGESYANKLSTDAASGSLPDVIDMMPKDAYTLAKAGVIENLSKSDSGAEKNYIPGAWKGITFKGQGVEEGAYGYPWYLTAGMMLYNKAIMKECGVDPDNLPTDWDSYYSEGEQFAKQCGNKYSWNASLPTIGGFAEYGADVMNKDQTKFVFNGEKGVELVQHYVDLYKAGVFSKEAVSANGTQSSDLFKQNGVATRFGFLYDLKDLKENAPEVYKNLGITASPAKHTPINMEVLAVSSTSKNKDAAMKFAAYATNNENQVAFAKAAQIFPSSANGTDDPFFSKDDGTIETKAISMIAKSIKEGEVTDPPQFVQDDMTNLIEQLGLAITGQTTAQKALDTVVETANQRLAQ